MNSTLKIVYLKCLDILLYISFPQNAKNRTGGVAQAVKAQNSKPSPTKIKAKQ
jgi:hypothetical protein